MKKQITFLVLILAMGITVAGCEKEQPKSDDNQVIENTESLKNKNDKENLFSDNSLGIGFLLDSSCKTERTESSEIFDKGQRKSINVICNDEEILSINFISIDYQEGVNEGSSFYYSGIPIDVNETNETLQNMLSKFNPKDIRKIKIGNKEAIEFYSKRDYITSWISEVIIMPYDKNGFSNLIITGPVLKTLADNDKYEISENEYLNNKQYQIFENIIRTFDFK